MVLVNPIGSLVLVRAMDEGNLKTTNPKCRVLLVFNRVYRLEIQSVMLVFSTPLVNCCPLPKVNIQIRYIQSTENVWLWGGGYGVLRSVVDNIQQEFNALFLTRFRTYQIATPPHNKNTI
jgi:hypothetical protein